MNNTPETSSSPATPPAAARSRRVPLVALLIAVAGAGSGGLVVVRQPRAHPRSENRTGAPAGRVRQGRERNPPAGAQCRRCDAAGQRKGRPHREPDGDVAAAATGARNAVQGSGAGARPVGAGRNRAGAADRRAAVAAGGQRQGRDHRAGRRGHPSAAPRTSRSSPRCGAPLPPIWRTCARCPRSTKWGRARASRRWWRACPAGRWPVRRRLKRRPRRAPPEAG